MSDSRKDKEEEIYDEQQEMDEEPGEDWRDDNELVEAAFPGKKRENIDFFKRPAHVLGGSFFNDSTGEDEESEGLLEKESCQVTSAILKGLKENKDYTMSPAVEALKEAMGSSAFPEDDPQGVIERLKKGTPVIFPTGWNSSKDGAGAHSVGLYAQLINNQLIIIHCNRGAGIKESKELKGNSGVLIYEGKPNETAYKELGEFFYREKRPSSNLYPGKEFYKELEGYLEKHGLKNIGFIPLQSQKTGTCAITNKIGLVAGLEAFQDKVTNKETWKTSKAKERYKEFTTACRKQEILLLVDRIKKDENLQTQMGYKMLIDLIERKAEKAFQGNERNMELIKMTAENLIKKLAKDNPEVISDIRTAYMNYISLREISAETSKERRTHQERLETETPKIKELENFLAELSKQTPRP